MLPSPTKHGPKTAGGSGETQASCLPRGMREDGGHVDQGRFVRDGEDITTMREGESALGIRRRDLDTTMDHQPNYHMTSGLQCDLKSSAPHREEYDIHHMTFKKSIVDKTQQQDNGRKYSDHPNQKHLNIATTLCQETSSNTNVTTSTSTLTTNKMTLATTTSTMTHGSSLAYPQSIPGEETDRAVAASIHHNMEMCEMRSPTTTHYPVNSSHHHRISNKEDILSTDIPHQDYQTQADTSTTMTNFSQSVSLRPLNADHHLHDFSPHHLLSDTPITTQLREHLTHRGRSIHHINDRDRSLDREHQQFSKLNRDPSLHSLDRYPSNNLESTVSTGNISTVTTSAKTFDHPLHHHLSLYPLPHLHQYQPKEEEDISQFLRPSTSTPTTTIPRPLLRREMRSVSQMINLNHGSDTRIKTQHPIYSQRRSINYRSQEAFHNIVDPMHKEEEFKAAVEQLRNPLSLQSCTMIDRPNLLPHYSLLNLNQSLQDLRQDTKLTSGNRIGSRFPSSGHLSRSITKLFNGSRATGDYISCDQLLTSLRRQGIEDELYALYCKKFASEDEDDYLECNEDCSSEDKWLLSMDVARYSSNEELSLGNRTARGMIRRLLEETLVLPDIDQHSITDEEVRRVIDSNIRSYEEEYRRRIDYDRLIDEEIQRFDEDLKKDDEIQRLRANDLSRNFGEELKRESGEKVIVARDSLTDERGRERTRRYGRDGSESSPSRFPSTSREQIRAVSPTL